MFLVSYGLRIIRKMGSIGEDELDQMVKDYIESAGSSSSSFSVSSSKHSLHQSTYLSLQVYISCVSFLLLFFIHISFSFLGPFIIFFFFFTYYFFFVTFLLCGLCMYRKFLGNALMMK